MIQGTTYFSRHILGWAIILTAGIVSTANLHAQDGTAPKVKPGDVNTEVSRVYTFCDKSGLGHQHAIEGQLTVGQLMVGSNSGAGKLVFDMRSFKADTDRARQYIGLEGQTAVKTQEEVTANMIGSSVLDVASHPTATFEIDSALPTGRQSERGLPEYELIGRFTLHGATKPLRIMTDIEMARGWLHIRGKFSILQTEYGIKPFSKVFGAVGVADQLVIHGDLWVVPNSLVTSAEIPSRK